MDKILDFQAIDAEDHVTSCNPQRDVLSSSNVDAERTCTSIVFDDCWMQNFPDLLVKDTQRTPK